MNSLDDFQAEHRNLMIGLEKAIKNHTGSQNSDFLSEQLYSLGIIGPDIFFSRSKDIRALVTLDRAMRDLQRIIDKDDMTVHAMDVFLGNLYRVRKYKEDRSEINSAYVEKGEKNAAGDFIDIDVTTCDTELMYYVAERANDIRAAIKRTILEIEESLQTKVAASKLNEQGIRIVDASRIIWFRATGTKAPEKDLNPASKFAKMLADVFEAAGTSGDPRSAFRAWVRERGSWSLDPPK